MKPQIKLPAVLVASEALHYSDLHSLVPSETAQVATTHLSQPFEKRGGPAKSIVGMFFFGDTHDKREEIWSLSKAGFASFYRFSYFIDATCSADNQRQFSKKR